MATRKKPTKRPWTDGFQERVAGRSVDLITRIDEGLPPLSFLPASDGLLIPGKRHLLAAPRKSGKSLTTLSHCVRMVLAGAKVIVLDRENGSQLYASRLEAILAAWEIDSPQRELIREQLLYIEWPSLDLSDGDDLAAWAARFKADLVIFDAQRMFLTDLRLDENVADDYARFAATAIEPLTHNEIATLILDNTGHADSSRARGSTSKGDLNEVLLHLKVDEPYSVAKAGRLRLVLEPGDSRFGTQGQWTMRLGGGEFGEWKPIEQTGNAISSRHQSEPERKARKLVMAFIRKNPGATKTQTIRSCKGSGKGSGEDSLKKAIEHAITTGEILPRDGKFLHVAE